MAADHGVCACIAATTLEAALYQAASAIAAGATLVEYRLDLFGALPNLRALVEGTPCPVIITCRRPEDGGDWTGAEADRRALLEAAIDAGAAFVDLEIDTARSLARRGATRRIVSYHSFTEGLGGVPEQVLGQLDAADADADIVKLVVSPQGFEDLAELLCEPPRFSVPSIVFGMGAIGQLSRVLCLRAGAPWTYAAFGEAVAPGQFTVRQLTEVLRIQRLGPATPLYGIIGDPVGHSLSPQLHNAALDSAGLDGIYLPVHVPRGSDLSMVLRTLARTGFCGLSVTIPHKAAFLACAEVTPDPIVGAIGATNTLVLQSDGQWAATNTDAVAAADSLEARLGPVAGRSALLLGAGGVARAIAFALKARGMQVTVTGRTAARAQALASALGLDVCAWSARGRHRFDAVINSTPVGMTPLEARSPLPAEALSAETLYFDTVYTPAMTRLLRDAQGTGAAVLTGREMFTEQARLQFALFTGSPPPATMRL